MAQLNAKKDGKGNIIISEDSFEMLLACLDNQKFVHEAPQNGDSIAEGEENYKTTQQVLQDTIDDYNRTARKILHQKYIFELENDDLFLTKKYEHQDELISWNGRDMYIIFDLFKNTQIKWEAPKNLKPIPDGTPIKAGTEPLGINENGFIVCKPEYLKPWVVETTMRFGDEYLTISEDGIITRPWKTEEVELIKNAF